MSVRDALTTAVRRLEAASRLTEAMLGAEHLRRVVGGHPGAEMAAWTWLVHLWEGVC